MFESKKKVDELYFRCCVMLDDIKHNTSAFAGATQYNNRTECILLGSFCYYIAGRKNANYATKVISKYLADRAVLNRVSPKDADCIQNGYSVARNASEICMQKGQSSVAVISVVQALGILALLGWDESEANAALLSDVYLNFYSFLQ